MHRNIQRIGFETFMRIRKIGLNFRKNKCKILMVKKFSFISFKLPLINFVSKVYYISEIQQVKATVHIVDYRKLGYFFNYIF